MGNPTIYLIIKVFFEDIEPVDFRYTKEEAIIKAKEYNNRLSSTDPGIHHIYKIKQNEGRSEFISYDI